ncbi:uncharacterized protein LOC144769726 [Lissotriton helveticus]
MVDSFSKFPIVEVVSSTAYPQVKKVLDKSFVMMGLPEEVKSDNGPPFQGREFQEYLENKAIRHRKITPLWPQVNVEVERLMRTLNRGLRIAVDVGEDAETALDQLLGACRQPLTAQPIGQESIYNIFKNCSSTQGEHKSAAYQWRTQNFTYQLVQSFCSSDACNKNDSNIEIPIQDETENGLYCKACLDLNNTSCQPSGTVKCTGKLTNCIYFGGIGRFAVDPVAISYRGCITIERTQDFPPFPMGTLERLDHLEFIKASPIVQT